MVDRIRWDTVSYLPFYYVFFQFLLLTIFNLQANILTTKDILSNLDQIYIVVQKQTVKNKAADMDLAKKLWEVSAKDVKLTEAEAAATLGHS